MSAPRRPGFLTLAFIVGLGLGACSGEIAGAKNPGTPGGTAPGADDPGGGPAPGTGPGGGPAGSPGASACAPTALPKARAWRLSHNQLKNTLLDVFGFAGAAVDGLPPDARLDGFGNDAGRLGLSPVLMEHYFRVGDEVAGEVARRSGDFIKCPISALGEGTCLGDFLKSVGRRAWRRPLDDSEQKELAAVYTSAAKADGPETGFKSLVTALVLSPNFLFRTELGSGQGRLTDYETASALSYMLWDAPPDAALLEQAAGGKLRDPAVLASEAKRLLGTGKRASEALNNFLRQWLKIDDLTDKNKDTTLFPFYTAQVSRDLLEETRLLFDDVVFAPGGDRSVKTLFTSTKGYASSRTAAIYGVNAAGDALAKVDLDASRRRGLLTSGAFLAAHAGADVTKVVDRGAFIREEFLCAEVPAPPQNFKFEDAAITEDMTAREKLLIHAKNPACASCHSLFDGIGFALENYDAVGKWRDTEKGKKIDSAGVLPLPAGGEVRFANFVELIDQLASKPDIYGCFASQYLSYATGRGVREIDSCERSALLAGFEKSGYRVDSLITGIVTSAAFSTRRN
jgi:hypothetical protein